MGHTMDTMTKRLNCVILAAGEDGRMQAPHAKALCEVAGKPLLSWVLSAVRESGIDQICVVADSDGVKKAAEGCKICEQTQRLGTGYAVLCAREFLQEHAGAHTLVLCGDAPFIDAPTIRAAYALHTEQGCAMTAVTAEVSDPSGYGRVIRRDGALAAIVEDADCDAAQRALREINAGAYWFCTGDLLDALDHLDSARGEMRLTDALAYLAGAGKKIGGYRAPMPHIALGANRPIDLLTLNEIASRLTIGRFLAAGVRFVEPSGVVIGPDVEIAPGAVIYPNCQLYGKTTIGAGAVIGPNTVLTDTSVGEGSAVNASQCADSVIGAQASIGPFSQLRPGSVIGDKVKIGDFVEVKNSNIGEGTSIAHLTYIGDSDVGRHCNFGCGVVVCNYDGEVKSRTTVGDFAFIGCNTNLVAPVKVGNRAYTAAATTVTKDVPDGALAVGRAKQQNLEGWAARKLAKYIEKKSRQ